MKKCHNLPHSTIHAIWWFLAWALLVATSLWVRSYYPIDETRYVSVAWEMWHKHSWLLPTLNDQPYSHKPPLMFWLFHLGWSIFGVNNWWPRILPALFAFGSLWLTRQLACRLWPQQPAISWLAPTLLLSCILWSLFTPVTMFDMILSFWVLLAMLGLVYASQGQRRGWVMYAGAVGLGVLAKGPVMFLHSLFPGLLACFWLNRQANPALVKWYGCFLLSLLASLLIPLAWAIPAAIQGGSAYSEQIFLSQTLGRVSQSFAHRHGWWWYLILLPVILFPWILWTPLLRSCKQLISQPLDQGLRFCLTWLLPTLLAFSLVSGKQPYYLLPLFPGFALLSTRLLQTTESLTRRSMLLTFVLFLVIGSVSALLPVIAQVATKAPHWLAQVSPVWGILIVVVAASLLYRRQYALDQAILHLSVVTIACVLIGFVGIIRIAAPTYNVEPIAQFIHTAQQQQLAVANVGRYYNQYRFLSRSTQAMPIVWEDQRDTWAQQHPDGYLIDYPKRLTDYAVTPALIQAYRGKYVVIWQGKDYVANQAETSAQHR